MKYVYYLLTMLLFLPITYASIQITTPLENQYNLGDKIPLSINIIPDKTTNALIKLTLKCTNKETLYYIAPIDLKKNKELNVEAPPINAFSEGLCNIKINLESLEGENLDGITSKEFTVLNRLDLFFALDKIELFPGDTIRIEGTATKKGKKIEDGSITLILDNKQKQINLDDTKFIYELKLDENIQSGEHNIIVKVNDSYGNFNEESKVIEIKAIPKTLEFNLNKHEFKPKEILQLKVNLLDQANDSIKGNLDLKLFKEKSLFKDEIIIFNTQIESNKEFIFTFNYSTLPYDYTLKTTFGDLKKEEIINIVPYSMIEMNLNGETVIIKNLGNVEYNNETTIILEKENKKYIINKKIKLDVGEETVIDLSKEVPSGNYTVTLPQQTITEERIIEKTVEKVIQKEVPKYIEKEKDENETTQEEIVESKEEPTNLIKNIEIEDNRPFYKKGFSWITGGVIAGAGLLLSRPKLASFTMIITLLSIIGYYNRKRIEKIIEKIRKKRERS